MHMHHIVICGLPHSASLLHKWHDFFWGGGGGALLSIKCVLISSETFVWNIFHSKKNWERYGQKSMLLSMYSAYYYCDILMKFKFSGQFLKKSSHIKFNENPSSGSRIVPCGWTGMMKLFTILQICVEMRIWVSVLASVAFVIKHIFLQNFVPSPTQALLGFWIQCVQRYILDMSLIVVKQTD